MRSTCGAVLPLAGLGILTIVYLCVVQRTRILPARGPWRGERTVVYTYIQVGIPSGEQSEAAVRRTLQVWLRNWYAHGYHPIVLTPADALIHPNYTRLRGIFAGFPTVNPPEYELACYLRWLAFREQGAGVFMDYDIVALGPMDVPLHEVHGLHSWRPLAPMLTVASSEGIDRQIALMAAHGEPLAIIDGRPHTSDMLIMRSNLHLYTHLWDEWPPVAHVSSLFHRNFRAKFGDRVANTSRDDLMADVSLYARLQRGTGLQMILPPGITIRGDPHQYGLGVAEERRDALAQLWPLPNDYRDVRIGPEWSADVDLRFLVFASQASLGNLDLRTRRAVEDGIERPDLVPLYIRDGEGTQLVLDYHVGYASKQTVQFEVREDITQRGSSDDERLFNRLVSKQERLLKAIRSIEQQVLRLPFGAA